MSDNERNNTMTEEKWRELTAKAIKGDSAAFEELYGASKRSVYFICSKMLNSEHDAKDAMQNTYITAYQKLSSLDDGANFLKWINGIAANKCREFFHGKSTESLDEKLEEGIEFTDEEFIPEEYVSDMERRRIIMHIIETELSDVQRQTVILYYYNQLTVSQIADEMSCPENTVKYRLCAAKDRIKEAVLIYEKEHDDRLHAIIPLPVLTRIFRTEAEQISVPDIPLHLPKKVSAPANTILKNAGGSKMKNALLGKIIAGVAAVGVIGGGIAIALNSGKDNKPTQVKAPVQVEESSIPTEVTEPIISEPESVSATETTTTTAAEPITSEENNELDYNFWRFDSINANATVYFDDALWEVVRYDDSYMYDRCVHQDNIEAKGLQLINEEKRYLLEVSCTQTSMTVSNNGGIETRLAGDSYADHLLINADALAPHGGLEVKSTETTEINGYETVIINYAYEYPDEPEGNDYYTRYYIIIDEGISVNFGLEEFGSKSDENLEELLKLIDTLTIRQF